MDRAHGRKTHDGVFNATGPAKPLGVGAMLDGIKAALHATAEFTWVDTDFLNAQKVQAWSDIPVWVPPKGDSAGFGSRSIRRALDQGLTFRSLDDTAAATLAWFRAQPSERQAKQRAGLTPEREKEVLAAWETRKKPA